MTEPAAPGFAVTADGTRLHVESYGSGDTVLLIQGLGYATWAWQPQVAELPAYGRLIAFDNRGTGRSGKPAGPYSMDLFAEDALAVLEQAGTKPAHVIGCSMGGYIALTLAARHPETVRSVVLIATSAGGAGSVGVPEPTRRAWAAASDLPPREFARQTMPLSFAPGWTERHPDRFAELLRERLRHPTPPVSWRSQYEACEAFLRDGLGRDRIRHPALIIHGTADRVVPYANAAPLAARLDRARMATLDGAGHLCWIERADEVNRLIAEFLADVRQGATRR